MRHSRKRVKTATYDIFRVARLPGPLNAPISNSPWRNLCALGDARFRQQSSLRDLDPLRFSHRELRSKLGISAREPVQADVLDAVRGIDPDLAAAIPAVAKRKILRQQRIVDAHRLEARINRTSPSQFLGPVAALTSAGANRRSRTSLRPPAPIPSIRPSPRPRKPPARSRFCPSGKARLA